MADNTKLFEDILLELSYRSDEGYPDFSKPEHITLLSEILTEWGMTDVKFELIKNLLREDDEEDKKYFHKGKGVYVKIGDKDKDDAQRFRKDDSGKYSAVEKDGESSEEDSKTKIGGAADFQHAPDIKKDKEKQKTKSEPTKLEKNKTLKDIDSVNEFNTNPTFADDGVSDDNFNNNPNIQKTKNQIEFTPQELDDVLGSPRKFPKKYEKVLTRLLNTKKSKDISITDFTNAAGGGTLSSTAGEILTTIGMSIKDPQKAKEFFTKILTLENANQDLKIEAQKRLNRDLSE